MATIFLLLKWLCAESLILYVMLTGESHSFVGAETDIVVHFRDMTLIN